MIRIQTNNVEHLTPYYLNKTELVSIKDIVMLKAHLKNEWQNTIQGIVHHSVGNDPLNYHHEKYFFLRSIKMTKPVPGLSY